MPILFSNYKVANRKQVLKDLVDYSKRQSYTTDTGLEAAEAAALLSYICWCAINLTEGANLTGKEFLDSLKFEEIADILETRTVKCIALS